MRKQLNGHDDQRADQGAAAAIAALVADIATARNRAETETKRAEIGERLLGELRAYWGIAAEQPSASIPPPMRRRPGRPKLNGGAPTKLPHTRPTAGLSTDQVAKAKTELAKLVATVGKLERTLAAAVREKQPEEIKTAIAAKARAERQGGELLRDLVGRKRLPISRVAARKFRRLAALSATDFDYRICKAQRLAVAAIQEQQRSEKPARRDRAAKAAGDDKSSRKNRGAEDDGAAKAARISGEPPPPSSAPAPSKSPERKPSPEGLMLSPRLRPQVGSWQTDKSGIQSREVTSIELPPKSGALA